jgi:lysophospholipase L1-like esterase
VNVVEDSVVIVSGEPASVTEGARSSLAFVVDSLARVDDPARSLSLFLARLKRLLAGGQEVVTIVHLGDSHVQAGYLTGRVARLLQERYGNAGRGWIAPFRLGKSNEPDDYRITSTVKEWTFGRCVQHPPRCPVGPGGIGILSAAAEVRFDVSVTPVNGRGYEFNRLVLYRGEEAAPLFPTGPGSGDVRISTSGADMLPPFSLTSLSPLLYPPVGMATDTVRLEHLADNLQLVSRPADGPRVNLYYGMNLTNGRPGVLYHAVGVNGARFADYTSEEYISRLAALRPALLIVSLGTNESFDRGFTPAAFEGQVDAFITLVKRWMPGVPLLLTTPPECYKRVTVNRRRAYARNTNTERVANALVKVARDNGIACWDLFRATGGKDSCKRWFGTGMMGKDRVHFTKRGYDEQGILLFNALTSAGKEGVR